MMRTRHAGWLLTAVSILASGCDDGTGAPGEVLGPGDDAADRTWAELVEYQVATIYYHGSDRAYRGDGFQPHLQDATGYRVTGTVRNVSGEPLYVVTTIATFYDAGGNLLEMNQHAYRAGVYNLAAGATGTFEIICSKQAHFAADFERVVRVRLTTQVKRSSSGRTVETRHWE